MNNFDAKSIEKICQEMRDISKKLPRPSETKYEKEVEQFGNNFFCLFQSLEDAKDNSDSIFVKEYIEKAETLYGEKWIKYLEENTTLINEIQVVIRQKRIFDKLIKNFISLSLNIETREISIQICEEINLTGIGNDIWNKLNPLLQEASAAMESYGIISETFYI